MDIVWLAAGLALLLTGAEALVRGGVGIASAFGVSPLIVGLTIVAYGTSTPELVIVTNAALSGSAGLAAGNVIGANIINLLLILGVAGVIAAIAPNPADTARSGLFLLAAGGILALLCATTPTLFWWHGAAMLALMAAVTFVSIHAEWRSRNGAAGEAADADAAHGDTSIHLLLIAGGVGLLYIGGETVVARATSLARAAGVSESLIGLTLVALGSSAPELAASSVAALRGKTDLALGNVMGSCIYNILAILGAAAVLTPVAIEPALAAFDVWVMLAAIVAIAPAVFLGAPIRRFYAGALLGGYALYLGALLIRAGLFSL